MFSLAGFPRPVSSNTEMNGIAVKSEVCGFNPMSLKCELKTSQTTFFDL